MQKGNSRNRFRNQCLAVKHNGAVVNASCTDAKKFPYLYLHPRVYWVWNLYLLITVNFNELYLTANITLMQPSQYVVWVEQLGTVCLWGMFFAAAQRFIQGLYFSLLNSARSLLDKFEAAMCHGGPRACGFSLRGYNDFTDQVRLPKMKLISDDDLICSELWIKTCDCCPLPNGYQSSLDSISCPAQCSSYSYASCGFTSWIFCVWFC